MTQTQHKKYLIDSIAEMETFIDKVIGNIYDRRDTITPNTLHVLNGIIDRKRENIERFKELLNSEYSHTIQ